MESVINNSEKILLTSNWRSFHSLLSTTFGDWNCIYLYFYIYRNSANSINFFSIIDLHQLLSLYLPYPPYRSSSNHNFRLVRSFWRAFCAWPGLWSLSRIHSTAIWSWVCRLATSSIANPNQVQYPINRPNRALGRMRIAISANNVWDIRCKKTFPTLPKLIDSSDCEKKGGGGRVAQRAVFFSSRAKFGL